MNNSSQCAPSSTIDDLRRRAAVIRQLREFFHDHQFWEVETPLLSAETVVDPHIEPIRVEPAALKLEPSLASPDYFLQTSPELGMKRLLAAGADRIFQICKAFRAGELGMEHNPEFTILEWYHCVDYSEGVSFLKELVLLFWPRATCRVLPYRDLFAATYGIDPLEDNVDAWRQVVAQSTSASRLGLENWDQDDCLNALLAEMQPMLGVNGPLIVTDWPASQAALARTDPSNPQVAQRFELYIGGRELANGYCELTDVDELVRRTVEANRRRVKAGKCSLPLSSRLVAALQQGLPVSCGVALGVDRLLMSLWNKPNLASTLAFPLPLA